MQLGCAFFWRIVGLLLMLIDIAQQVDPWANQ